MTDEDRDKWTLEQWRQYALQLEDRHDKSLDGHVALVNSLMLEIENQRLNAAALMNTLLQYVQQSARPAPADAPQPKKRGRPSKHSKEDAVNVARYFDETLKPQWVAAHPNEQPSDLKVATWWAEQQFVQGGKRALRAHTKEYQGKLKTLLNIVGDGRDRLYRNFPKKG